MKWFKHEASANMDAKLQEVLLDYGLEGYGLYWYCLELIAGNVDADKLTFELEHDCRIIARNVGSSAQKVQEMMTTFVNLGLFEESQGRITCLKLAKVSDDYTAKLVRSKPLQAIDSKGVLESPTKTEKDPLDKNRLDKNRLDNIKINNNNNTDLIESEFGRFWVAGMTKQAKTKSLVAFKKQFKEAQKKSKGITEEQFADYLIADIEKRIAANVFGFDRMHPTTYLNQQRWNDDIVAGEPEKEEREHWSAKM